MLTFQVLGLWGLSSWRWTSKQPLLPGTIYHCSILDQATTLFMNWSLLAKRICHENYPLYITMLWVTPQNLHLRQKWAHCKIRYILLVFERKLWCQAWITLLVRLSITNHQHPSSYNIRMFGCKFIRRPCPFLSLHARVMQIRGVIPPRGINNVH